jgi:pimeloyl-ACP methyl ester carboxylesterase
MALAFDSHGSGPPLVLLHGTGSHRGMWDPVVGTLARERRVIALDIPGFAGSATESAEPTPAGFTTYLERWFAEQGLGRPHVAGNSMGGGLALELARRHAVASATALSPVGFWTPRELAFAQRSLRASRAIVKRLRPATPALTRTAAGRVAMFSQIYGRPWRMSPADAMAAVDAFLDAPAFEPALEAFGHYRFGAGDELRGVPVTVAWGTRDALLIPRQAARARRLLPWA